MSWLEILDIVSRWIFIFCISYYLITNLQWYNYSLYRVITKHHKQKWHFLHFVIPICVFLISSFYAQNMIFYAYLYIVEIPLLTIWTFKLDKKLVFTKRVLRFFVICFAFVFFNEILTILSKDFNPSLRFLYLLPLLFGCIFSKLYEILLLNRYTQMAKDKLALMASLRIIAITGSFGKTSIKNFLYQILQNKYTVYATPRSVNTFKGIIDDINKNLDFGTDIYIAEAGARQSGDIKEIALLLQPQYAIIGEVGYQHIEYFKTFDNVLQTKLELLESKRLKKAFVYEKNPIPEYISGDKKSLIQPYPDDIRNISATLEGTSFEIKLQKEWYLFETKVLGEFNVDNISVAIVLANALKIPIADIQKSVSKLQPTPHRLNLLNVNQKIIIDDSFNGNLKGMLEAVRLSSLYPKRKIIVTPGLVESDAESNIALAKEIDKVFDIVIITGELNSKILSAYIQKPQKIILKDKAQLENILQASTQQEDLILFANDAPSYI
ncbi:Mur ligase family protein [Helicobacter cappadocius]|uniref:UDP-N-acetylmuramoyl-tripeptide--D-alanyl-D-alanine ligase n=1 Tax=Helicobacter cappadocius TaxID=3063998 RepID=A0AA90PIW1_9HELI|nr:MULTISPECIES: UDP-N-acetylmuramoyl-tripeptide--D-alanyl-D-alanine ligase [unclassified Helicobacter]MDO7252543.1 UDP-N-acetylmuramoyl-tripeptide--D-alanyl-D-alanine ligase [Helicobacter sp. faydin-H75]MDP2538410.1 UDP-N-acetylmuramoyl-tripeptide--D-alanyl-D-alanine ligase [Helicobacter sp. faydin-H76]